MRRPQAERSDELRCEPFHMSWRTRDPPAGASSTARSKRIVSFAFGVYSMSDQGIATSMTWPLPSGVASAQPFTGMFFAFFGTNASPVAADTSTCLSVKSIGPPLSGDSAPRKTSIPSPFQIHWPFSLFDCGEASVTVTRR